MNSSATIDDSMKAFRLIQQSLGLAQFNPFQSTIIESPLLGSIHLEYSSKCVTQLGVSIFDSLSLGFPERRGSISNECPISSTLYLTKVSKYEERRRKPSHFGEKYDPFPKELHTLLKEILTPKDKQGRPRDAVIVGHNIKNDLKVIERCCGLNIYNDVPLVKAILDTQPISQSILKTAETLSLKHLLSTLNLEYIGLHNAAHDSRYTLRVLLLMLHRATWQQAPASQTQNQDTKQRLDFIEAIAKFFKPRERILWCANSPRVRLGGNSDMLDREQDDSDLKDSGLLASIF